MNEFVQRIAHDYPVRRKAREKEAMRSYLMGTLRSLGYAPSLETDSSLLRGISPTTNVVVGDPEQARVILAAHCDTGLRELFPPLLCPTRPVTYVLYQMLTPVAWLLGSFALSLAVSMPLHRPGLMMPLFLVLLIAGLLYLRFGPSETRTLNDNTSGVAALLETAKRLTPRWRGKVCFVFFDAGSGGTKGAKAFRRRHSSVKEKNFIVLDSVGVGDELLLLPSKYARWNGELLDALNQSFADAETPAGKSVFLKTDGLTYYPSDNRAFRYSVAVCAVTKMPGFGRCILPRKATAVDEGNLQLLSDGLCRLVAKFD